MARCAGLGDIPTKGLRYYYMTEMNKALVEAEAIAQQAKRQEIDRLVKECEGSEHRTIRSLADVYRRLSFGYY